MIREKNPLGLSCRLEIQIMSFSSPYVIKKISNLFRVDVHVIYVAVLDYDGNIKVQMVRDTSQSTATFEARSIDGARAIYGMYQTSKQFFDETNLITISNETNTELIYFSNFVIYVLTNPIDDEEKTTQIRNKIKKLGYDLSRLFGIGNNDFEKHEKMHRSR